MLYRGAGRPRQLRGGTPGGNSGARNEDRSAEIRRRNFITRFPYRRRWPDVRHRQLSKTLEQRSSWPTWQATRHARPKASRGKLRGPGYSCYIEACGIAPSNVAGSLGARAGLFEAGEIRVHPTGKVTVFTGSHSHGQGHETTFSQVVASRLGIPVEDVEIVHGDTGRVLFGMGTYGSRSIAVGGTAIVKALDKVIEKGKKIAAHLMEAAETDVEFKDGIFKVSGTDKQVPFAQVSLTAYVPHNYPLDKLEPGLNEQAFYDPTNFTFPAGSYVCEVEVDPETGVTRIESFTAVDDFGNVINPMIVEGQVHGGLVQGIGQALTESCRYDKDSGQLLTGSMLDYCLPRADDVPSFKIGTEVTPCTHNPLGVKGCGEAGAIGAPALINAITDAIGVREIEMPATAGVSGARREGQGRVTPGHGKT
jgi:carbon-monoxide dehydrogenase large subunit